MGRKVGKNRSEALSNRLNSLTSGWPTHRESVGLSKHQWRNFMYFADTKIYRLACEQAGIKIVKYPEYIRRK